MDFYAIKTAQSFPKCLPLALLPLMLSTRRGHNSSVSRDKTMLQNSLEIQDLAVRH